MVCLESDMYQAVGNARVLLNDSLDSVKVVSHEEQRSRLEEVFVSHL